MLTLPQNVQYPWHQTIWNDVGQMRKINHLPHALLLLGNQGLGQEIFAHRLAESMLCQQPGGEGQPCQICHPCHLMKAQSHPDFLWVSPPEGKHIISVEQIREVVNSVNETSAQNGWRIIVITPANTMNKYAANALLKTLEEPPAKTLLILVSDLQKKLPITILSRCQKIVFNPPTRAVALQWMRSCSDMPLVLEKLKNASTEDLSVLLNYTEGAPLTALDMLQQNFLELRQTFFTDLIKLSEKNRNPLAIAKQWLETDMLTITNFLLSWVVDMLRLQLTDDVSTIQNKDFVAELEKFKQNLSSATLTKLINVITTSRQLVMLPHNLNKQLLLEDLFIQWAHYVSS